MKNPIIDNRIVNDTTFAIRLLSFIDNVQVCDAMSEEEKDYIQCVANRLLVYQKQTATDNEELQYLGRIKEHAKQLQSKSDRFAEICREMADLHAEKNAIYGDSYMSVAKEWGIGAAITPLENKMHRIKSILHGTDVKFESLQDSVKTLPAMP